MEFTVAVIVALGVLLLQPKPFLGLIQLLDNSIIHVLNNSIIHMLNNSIMHVFNKRNNSIIHVFNKNNLIIHVFKVMSLPLLRIFQLKGVVLKENLSITFCRHHWVGCLLSFQIPLTLQSTVIIMEMVDAQQ